MVREALLDGPGAGSTLVIAVSGGGDSVALLHGLARLREPLALRLVVAHLDHALRPDSGDDAAFVGQLALDLGLMGLRERRDVVASLARSGGNLEEAARLARYAFLEEAARAVGADAVAIAHTADDQAETVLMHLLRGAGLAGLKGMTVLAPSPAPGATVPLFRPLLRVARATLRAWLRDEGLAWRDDPTNKETSLLRNRVRHELLPRLEQERPGLRERLAQTAHLLAQDHAVLEAATDTAWSQVAARRGDTIWFDRAAFLAQPPALRRRLLRRAVRTLRPTARDLPFEPVQRALDTAARGESGARISLTGDLFLGVRRERLWLGETAPTEGPTLHEPLPLKGTGCVAGAGLRVTIEAVGRAALPDDWRAQPPTVALLDAAQVRWPLALRPPRSGDRWQPLGLGGQAVDLQGWLASHHVPPAQRQGVPLLVDADDQILWVVGRQVGHLARVRDTSEALLQVTVEATEAR